MKTPYKIAIGCAGLVTLGAALWPQVSFGQQPANKEDSLRKVVSKRFDNATASQVLAWLVEQGFNYVAKDNEFENARVSLNIDHKTVRQAADDLAAALGGFWTMDNGVYIFHRGIRLNNDSNFLFKFKDGEPATNAEERAKHASEWAKQNQDRAKSNQDWSQLGQDWAKNSEEWSKWGQEYAKNMQKDFGPDSPKMKEFQEKMKALGSQMGKIQVDPEIMKDLKVRIEKFKGDDGSKNGGQMSKEQAEELAKQMQIWGEKFGHDFSKKMGDQKQWEEFGKSMQDWAKSFAKDHPNGESFDFKTMPPMPAMPAVPPITRFREDNGAPMPPDFDVKVRRLGPPMQFRDSGVKSAIDSLSDSQRSLMRSRGYLTPSDLTGSQREMLNLPSSGEWDLDYKVDGRELRIKDH